MIDKTNKPSSLDVHQQQLKKKIIKKKFVITSSRWVSSNSQKCHTASFSIQNYATYYDVLLPWFLKKNQQG